MNLKVLSGMLCLLTTGAFGVTNDPVAAGIEGREVARRLIQSQPAQDSTASGVLRIFPRKQTPLEIPVKFQTIVTATNWLAVYTAKNADAKPTTLTIVHNAERGNQYVIGGTNSGDPQALTGNASMVPFAGSDFWLADLGLEFLHWPDQRISKKELRKGQSCYVLESINPHPAPDAYARVVSWIDIDSVREAGQAAILHADAYDAQGKRWKEFDPLKIKKVDGQWHLREMEMYNARTRSRTVIEFDLGGE